ncbi:hypothetical protein TrST_g12646 [Triparma strigata]|uniref:EF-hand domain-containing protein n=1 Tax=Triparma strigata TaxID=1606541 RepID=A0A9W7C4A8_9STRA|nr:hypothetical protein TrST_g12646 [Triparma strigata]
MGSGVTKDTYAETPHTRERRGSSVLTGAGTTEMVLSNLEHSTAFDKSELKVLQNKFVELAQKQGNPNTITEEEFREALGAIGIIESDQIILHQLFGVMDKEHDNQINFKNFVTCASVMVSGNIKEKLNFSFELYCGDGMQEVSKQDMENILKHLNTTASWFGDPSLHDDEVSKLVDDVFEKHDAEKSGTLTYSEYMHAVAENPILVQFFNGKGSIPRPNKAKVLLPIWWVDYNLKFEGELKGKGVEFLKCDEFSNMVMESKKNRACKSSMVIANLAEGDAELLDLRQEWHGPFDDKTFLDSDFAKKVEATEGVSASLTKYKSVDF